MNQPSVFPFLKQRIVFPDDTQRLSIVGATGSGKTQLANWHLSRRSYTTKPWIVYDFKHDSLINSIPGARYIDVDEPPPQEPGLYIVQPVPESDDDLVMAQMYAIWRQGNTGVYVDEGYMLNKNNRAFRALLTQGRSKRIPMIILSQRPVWLDRFVFSESEFYHVFRLQDKKDIKKTEEFIPKDLSQRLPKYSSYYYNAVDDVLVEFGPAPSREVILATFARRLKDIPRVV